MLNTFIDIKPHHLNLQSRFLLGETFFESKTRKKKDKIPNAKIKGLERVKVYIYMTVFRKSCSRFRRKIGIPCVTPLVLLVKKVILKIQVKCSKSTSLKKSGSFPAKRASAQIIVSCGCLYKRFKRRHGKQQE